MRKQKKKLDTFLESMEVDYYGEEINPAKEAVSKALKDKDDLTDEEWDKLGKQYGDTVVGDAYVELKKEGEYEGTDDVDEEDGEEPLDVDDSEEEITDEPEEDDDGEEESIIEMDEAKRAVQFERRHYDYLVGLLSKILSVPVLKLTEGKKLDEVVNVILQELAPTNPGFKREVFETKLKKAFRETLSAVSSAKEDIK